jgi:hypothetical protein
MRSSGFGEADNLSLLWFPLSQAFRHCHVKNNRCHCFESYLEAWEGLVFVFDYLNCDDSQAKTFFILF